MHKEAQTETLQDLNLSIENYVKDNLSICREERQYALYLSNVLRYYGSPAKRAGEDMVEVEKIFKACGFKEEGIENIVIENVYYEATFMRDFFERNRRIEISKQSSKQSKMEDVCLQKSFTPSSYIIRDKDNSFNRKLLRFCWEKVKNEEIDFSDKGIDEKNYGRNKMPDRYKEIKNLTRAMMNSKPDLAVIYHCGKNAEKKKLLFLECKFESSEDKIDGDNGVKYSQTKIQGYIAEFLCKFLCNTKNKYLTDVETSEIMKEKKGESKLVRFDRNDETADNISIKNLIKVEKRIFEKQ